MCFTTFIVYNFYVQSVHAFGEVEQFCGGRCWGGGGGGGSGSGGGGSGSVSVSVTCLIIQKYLSVCLSFCLLILKHLSICLLSVC